MMNDSAESPTEYVKRKLTPYRVTMNDLEAVVAREEYYQFPGSLLTVCCLTTLNGFSVTGESACVDPENFDAVIGQKVARAHAVDKLWALEGYLMKEAFHRGHNPEHEKLHRDSRLEGKDAR